eukprot:5942821-Pyramimonas_sp.AAC.1
MPDLREMVHTPMGPALCEQVATPQRRELVGGPRKNAFWTAAPEGGAPPGEDPAPASPRNLRGHPTA